MSKASETKLNELHDQLARTLITMTAVREVEEVVGEGEDAVRVTKTVDPSPAALAVAAKFLKDNSIFSTPEQSDALTDLQNQLKQKQARRPSSRDLKEAMGKLGQELLQ